jgi:putative transposase
MQSHRKTFHAVHDIKFHLVWITKYRKPVLHGEVATCLRDLIRDICTAMDVEIIKGHVSKDHPHIFVSVPPYVSVS